MLKLSRDSIRLRFFRGHFWVTRSSWCELWTTGLVEGKIEAGNHWVSPSNIEMSGQFCLQPMPWWMAGKGTLGCRSFFGELDDGSKVVTWPWTQDSEVTFLEGFFEFSEEKRAADSKKSGFLKDMNPTFGFYIKQLVIGEQSVAYESGLSAAGRGSVFFVFASGKRGSGSSGAMSPVSCPKKMLVLRRPRDDSMVNGYGLDHSHPFPTTFAPGRWLVGVFFALARVSLWTCGREKGERLRDLGFEDQNDTSQICQIPLWVYIHGTIPSTPENHWLQVWHPFWSYSAPIAGAFYA